MQERWLSTRSAIAIAVEQGLSTEIAVDQLIRALRADTLQAKAEIFFENMSENAQRQVMLPATFWDHAELMGRYLSPMKIPHWCEWNGSRSPKGSLACDITVREADVRRLWGNVEPEVKGRGGKPPSEGWADVAASGAAFLYESGLPNNQADLIRHIQTACGDSVGETQLKAFVSKLVKKARDLGLS